jgi:dephospho-CoA kinase
MKRVVELKIIGITGGIGSGKSTVSVTLRDLGAAVVDADVISRNITAPGGKAYDELLEYFGGEIAGENGEIDRTKLAAVAFGDKVKLHALNCITHRHIADKIRDTVELLKSSGKWDIIVIDAPIPVEKGFLDLADEVWTVTADLEVRIRRVMERSGYTREEVVKRMEAQLRDDEYLAIADQVLNNNGSVEELEQAVVKLFLQKKQEWQR